MMGALEERFSREGIPFHAIEARMRCMPHTIHLSAIELLVAIGAFPHASATSGSLVASGAWRNYQATPDNYQESVLEPLSTAADNLRSQTGDLERHAESDSRNCNPEVSSHVLPALDKIRRIVRVVRSSPQRKCQWLDEVTLSLRCQADTSKEALMLILDVKTRWSSTHQML
ncbi:hypothetical protein WOLCODRAFT_110592, partial [Wolfiporia cocos MD-104 SS10]